MREEWRCLSPDIAHGLGTIVCWLKASSQCFRNLPSPGVWSGGNQLQQRSQLVGCGKRTQCKPGRELQVLGVSSLHASLTHAPNPLRTSPNSPSPPKKGRVSPTRCFPWRSLDFTLCSPEHNRRRCGGEKTLIHNYEHFLVEGGTGKRL